MLAIPGGIWRIELFFFRNELSTGQSKQNYARNYTKLS